MRLIIQRVTQGCVSVQDKVVGKIGKGMVVLVGLHKNEDPKNLKIAASKLLKLRIWDTIADPADPDKKLKSWDTNVVQNDFELLIVSQFTLYGKLNGNKPDFHQAKEASQAKIMFNEFVDLVKKEYSEDKVQTGAFGEYMKVDIEGDGPVTIEMEY